MSVNCYSGDQFNFIYCYTLLHSETEKSCTLPIRIPLESNVTVRELSYNILKVHNLPLCLEFDLIEKLQMFVDDKIDQLQCQNANLFLNHKDKLRRYLLPKLNDENNQSVIGQCENSKRKAIIHPENFYLMYHTIIHSGLITPQLMQLENHNSDVIRNLLADKEEHLSRLNREKTQNIESILVNGSYSEKEINLITKRNFLLVEKYRNDWNEKILNVRNDQKIEFYTWIKNTYEDLVKDGPRQGKSSSIKDRNEPDGTSPNNNHNFPNFVTYVDDANIEESYTINLGSQLKTTHNLRLISADILKFCNNICTQQRLQTAMSLYSNSLSAIILLVDKSINSYASINSDFAKLCLGASENHFSDFDAQLNAIKSEFVNLQYSPSKKSLTTNLKVGDVYITKHSNLSETHIIFHLVTDDSIKSPEINSRHPVILGIRNILKISYIYDIAHISIPLLLLHHMNQDITIQWCLRRAELVLKCVKGFMIEMSSLLSLNDNENKTIQLVVPKGISQELFSSLSAIFPSVFRLSNTLFLTANNN